MVGIFRPIGAPSLILPSPYSTLFAESYNGIGNWTLSNGCTAITPKENVQHLFFECSQSGSRTISFSSDENTSQVTFEFVIGKRNHNYIWHIVPEFPVNNSFCSETSLCFTQPNGFSVRIWISTLFQTSGLHEQQEEYQNQMLFPSETSRMITKRFHKLGEFPSIYINGQKYHNNFLTYNHEGNYWTAKLSLNDQYPQKFAIYGHEIADYLSDVYESIGSFYYSNLIPYFENLFRLNMVYNYSESQSTFNFCECFPNMAAYSFNNNMFITLSSFDKFACVTHKNGEKFKDLCINPHFLVSITQDNHLYYSKKGEWNIISEVNITQQSKLRTSTFCILAPSKHNTLSSINDMFAVSFKDLMIRVYYSIECNDYEDFDLSNLTNEIYDFNLNSYLLFVLFKPMDQSMNKIGTVLYDLKQNSSKLDIIDFIDHPCIRNTPSGRFFIYGNKLITTTDLTTFTAIELPCLHHDERIVNLISNQNHFAFLTNQSRIFYGDMTDFWITNLWSPIISKTLNIYFKDNKLYSIYCDKLNKTVKTQFIFSKIRKDYQIMSYCLNCSKRNNYELLDLDQEIVKQYSIAVIHTDHLDFSIHFPSFIDWDYNYSIENSGCGHLIQMINLENSKEVNFTFSNPFHINTKMKCSLFHLNISAKPTSLCSFVEASYRTIESAVVNMYLKQKDKIFYTEHFQLSAQCRSDTRLKLIYDDKECFSDEDKCTFTTTYGQSKFKPRIFIYDGDVEREELIEDFVMYPLPSKFNKDDKWEPDYSYELTVGDVQCLIQPQNYMNTINIRNNHSMYGWSKYTYQNCFEKDGNLSNLLLFNPYQDYEILNSTHNCINFIGDTKLIVFNLTVLGFKQTYCPFHVIVEVQIKNRSMSLRELLLPSYLGIVLIFNAGVFIFWIQIRFRFGEILLETKQKEE